MDRSNIHNLSSQGLNNQFITEQMSIFTEINNNNNQISQLEKNKIFAFMKNIVSNPLLREQMEKHFTQKDNISNNHNHNHHNNNKNTYITKKQNESLPVSKYKQEILLQSHGYVIQPSQQAIPEPLRDPNHNNNFKKTHPSTMHKKGKDVLSNYNTNQSKGSDQQKQQSFTKSQQIQHPIKTIKPSFQDMPIKSNYIQNIQSSQFNYGYEAQPDQQKFNNKKQKKNRKQSEDKVEIKMQNKYSKFTELEDRPINGTKKQFKELLRQKFQQTPFDSYINHSQVKIDKKNNHTNQNEYDQAEYNIQNQDEGDYQNENRKPKRQFLKRGTRQYLSSAKDKVIKDKKKNNNDSNNMNNSILEKEDRNRTPKRQVSQNRILSKRNVNNNDKSVSIIKNNKQQNQYKDQSFYQEPDTRRSTTPKNQRINNKKDKSPGLPPKNINKINQNIPNQNTMLNSSKNNQKRKKDSKNVFDDDSSDQSDNKSDEKNASTFKQKNFMNKQVKTKINSYQPQKQFTMFDRQKKNQVIQGVFLTKSQLDTILQKYGSSLNQSKNIHNDKNQQKFNELRKKYTDLCRLLQKQKSEHQQQMQKQREQFQILKANQIQKIKNQKRVMQRQLKSTMPSQSHNTQKDRQQVQNLRKQMQKQKDQQKKKDKNNKILIEKYKKQNQDLKLRIEKIQSDLQKAQAITLSNQNSFANLTNSQKNLSRHTNDKSQSKIIANKDVSPLKTKNNKSMNKTQENQQDQENKNFKKTVPMKHSKDTTKSTKNNSSANMKKDKSFDSYQKDQQDENLPTFKVASNKNQSNQMKQKQKKYQYVQSNSEQQKISINKNNSKQFSNNIKPSGKNLTQNKKKNVFSNKFDSSSSQNDQQNQSERSDNDSQNESEKQGFLKNNLKFNKLSDLITNKFSIKDVTPQIISKLFKYESNQQYKKYIERIQNPRRVIVNSSQNGVDRKTTNIYNDKSKQMLFENGVKKVIFQTGYLIIYFKNGDIKQTLSDGTILYYFKQKQVDQITLTNGINIYRFDNNQVEIHFDGGKYIQIRHPDGTIKVLGSPIH